MGGETDSIIERVIEYCRRVDREFRLKQIEPIGYTADEIQRMLNEGNTFIENIFREGKDVEPNKIRS